MERYKGILLSKTKYKEFDELLVLYVDHVGILSAIIHGSLKKNNKYNGKIEIFATYYFDMVIRRNLSAVYGFELKTRWSNTSDDLLPLFINGAQINELIKKAVPEKQTISGLFFLIESLYEYIPSSKTPELAVTFLSYKLAPYLGISYTFSHCVSCGSTEQITAFSFQLGGVVCTECCQFFSDDIIEQHKVKVLIAFARLEIQQFITASISGEDAAFLVTFWKEIFDNQLGIVLKSQT